MKRTGRFTRHMALLLALLLLSALLLPACQPTPEEDIVVNRGDGALEAAIAATAVPSEQPYQAPSVWQETMEVGGVICRFDAEVSMSADSAHEVYRVRRRPFDTDVLQSFLQSLSAAPESAYETAETVEQIQAQIEAVLRGEPWDRDRNGNIVYRPYADEEERIAELQAALLQAEQIEMLSPAAVDLSADPFRYTYVLPDGVHWSVGLSENEFFALTYGDARLQPESDVQLGFARFEEPPGTTIGDVSVDVEVAVARAQAALAALGAEHLGVARIEKGRLCSQYQEDILSTGYIVSFARSDGNSIPVDVRKETAVGLLQYEPSEYAPPWSPERAEVYVDVQGVQSIWWTDPVTVTETVNENVALLPFEKIQARVRDLIRYGLSWLPEDAETTVEVTQIVLSNVLSREKDSRENGLLLPCWIVRYENTDSFGVTMQTVIAVSAIDGSRVDPLQLMALAPTAS